MKIKNKLIVGLITASLLLCLISPVYASQPLNVLSTSAREGATNCRVAGYDRYQTAIRIAEKLDNVTHIAVVTGEDYADALSIGSVAGKLNMPVILVEKNTLPSSVKSYLASKNITKSYVVGDQDLIGTAVLSQLPNVDIISDYTRYDKNIAILKKFEANFTTDSVMRGDW